MKLSKAAKSLMDIFESYFNNSENYACKLTLREIKTMLWKTHGEDVPYDKLNEVLCELFAQRLCARIKRDDAMGFDEEFIQPSEAYVYLFISPELHAFHKSVEDIFNDGLAINMIADCFKPSDNLRMYTLVTISRNNFDSVVLGLEVGYADENDLENLLSNAEVNLTTSWVIDTFLTEKNEAARTNAILNYVRNGIEALKIIMVRRHQFIEKTFPIVLNEAKSGVGAVH